jgi:hypothetical protein
MNGGKSYRLVLRLDGSETMDALSVEIVEGDGVAFASSQYGVEPGGPSQIAKLVENLPLRPGTSASWRLLIEEEHSAEMHLQARVQQRRRCVAGAGTGLTADDRPPSRMDLRRRVPAVTLRMGYSPCIPPFCRYRHRAWHE